MSVYPPPPAGYGCGATSPPQPQPQPYRTASPYGSPAPSQPYGAPSLVMRTHYSEPYGAPCATPASDKPPKDKPHSYAPAPGCYPPSATYASPFASLVPSAFPPGTDPIVVAGFQLAYQDGSGFIDDKELQTALSSYNQSFSLRTVRLLMYHFTNTNTRKIGPKDFTSVFYGLQNWRVFFFFWGFRVLIFSIDCVHILIIGGNDKAIEYDNFIECFLTVKGLTEKFREQDCTYSGSATFTYEAFMLTVLPFLMV
ncbi:hypothetical protein GH714_034858 [Hevea brasiliensis]|uniref:EF-hand domain-containing protein n=1 Tax=Hevea brasiliensis TaxID=3981 RepID=A0A6A6M5F8_HEVBR|nr:hypothetical protein GH714_034858 [Hevea brasiliensis]